MSGFGKLGVAAGQDFAKCERCGAVPFGTGRLCRGCNRRGKVKAAFAVIVAAELIFAAGLIVLPGIDAAKPAVARLVQSNSRPFAVAAASGWSTYETHDAVLHQVTHHARLNSAAPRNDGKDPDLQGVTAGTLELSSSEHGGKSVVVSFPKVDAHCAAARCSLRAAFDETQPESFAFSDESGGGQSDQAATVLRLADYDRFTQRLAVAHDLTLVASLGGKHSTIMRFSVAGYDTAAAGARIKFRLVALPLQAGRPYPG